MKIRGSNRVRPVILGSRDQFCVNPKVRHLKGNSLNNACGDLCKNRKCKFRNRLDAMQEPEREVFGTKDEEKDVKDVEDLVGKCEEAGVCPFYFNRGMVEQGMRKRDVKVDKEKEKQEGDIQEVREWDEKWGQGTRKR